MSRRVAVSILLLGMAALLTLTLVMLGNWQLRRLEWKTELLAAIEARAFGDAVPAPQGKIYPAAHVYRRVSIKGNFLHDHTRLVKAVTDLGPGFWVMTPLKNPGRTVWINRGFVPTDRRAGGRYSEPANDVQVVGLLRATEPGGTLLQANDPAAGRWYSRDVVAMSQDAGITTKANWFIDAARKPGSAGPQWPRAGLTRIAFRNTHLSYALTWYTMALALATGIGYLVFLERRQHSGS